MSEVTEQVGQSFRLSLLSSPLGDEGALENPMAVPVFAGQLGLDYHLGDLGDAAVGLSAAQREQVVFPVARSTEVAAAA